MPMDDGDAGGVVARHMKAILAGDVDALMADYAADAVLYAPQGPVRGRAALREFLAAFLADPPEGLPEAFETVREDVEDEIGYIVWRARPGVELATDTFVIRDGKIAVQTFASYPG